MVQKLRVNSHGRICYPVGLVCIILSGQNTIALQIISWISNRSKRSMVIYIKIINPPPWCSLKSGRFLIIICIALWTTQSARFVDRRSVVWQIFRRIYIKYKTTWQKDYQINLSMWIHSWGSRDFPPISSSTLLNLGLNHVILSFYKIQYRAKAVSRQACKNLCSGLLQKLNNLFRQTCLWFFLQKAY